MINKAILIIIASFSLGGMQVAQAEDKSVAEATKQHASNHGMISAVDIQEKTIQIGEKTYGIIDGVQVYSKDHQLISQLALSPGQQIEYSVAPQPLDKSNNSPLPDQVITTVRILSGFKEDAIQY